jgi:hypothetical protein
MIYIAMLMMTHPDDKIMCTDARIITGMSNAGWQASMVDKSPSFLKGKIFHHGKLDRAKLEKLKDTILITDEIDSANKPGQKLHKAVYDLLDIDYLKKNNIWLVIVSATMLKELYDVHKWGDLHSHVNMEVPPNYIGHHDFLIRGILQEFYKLDNVVSAVRWIREDVLSYGSDFRTHIVRVNPKSAKVIQAACAANGVDFVMHTTVENMNQEEFEKLFFDITRHCVIGIKGFFRRADYIPNAMKLRIGATHELCTDKVDNNVQIQGLVGRMSGYWRDAIDGGHKTGPHRTSVNSIHEYLDAYADPFGNGTYATHGFVKKNGAVKASPTMLSAPYVKGLAVEEDEPSSEFVMTDLLSTKEDARRAVESSILDGPVKAYDAQCDAAGNWTCYNGTTFAPMATVDSKAQLETLLHLKRGISKPGGERKVGGRVHPVRHEGLTKWVGVYRKDNAT